MNSGQVLDTLAALAHEHRLGVYRMLVEAGPPGLNASTLASRLQVAPSSLSFHLEQLRRAGLLTRQRKGRELIYGADFGGMNGLVEFLMANCCGGVSSACGKAHSRRRLRVS